MRARATDPASSPLRVLLAGTEPWARTTRTALTEGPDGANDHDGIGGQNGVEFVVAGTSEEAIDALDAPSPPVDAPPPAVDVAVVARELDDGESLALLERLGDVAPTIPVVVHPERGDESFASAALKRGATDYVPVSEREQLAERVLTAVEAAGQDTTRRPERERALTALHSTAQDLLYAETAEEITHALVADATAALGADGAAFYRFEGEEALLRPVVVTRGLERLHGPLPALATDDNSIVGRTFIDGEPTAFGDVRDAERLTNPATDLRGCVYVPIGEYGVLVAGSERSDAFDPLATEVAEVVAATAEAAFDRVNRVAERRDRDRELQRRDERLTELDRINDLVREVGRAVVRADTRQEIERAVCATLTSAGRFGFAWIADGDPPEPRAFDGGEPGYLDAVREDLAAGIEPTAAASERGEPVVVGNVAEELPAESWRRAALERGFQSALAVPLDYRGVRYGMLGVYATESGVFDEELRDVIVELGETVAAAVGGLERKAALLEGPTTELAYETTDPSCLLYAIARRADCSLEIEGGVQQVEDGVRVVLAVEGRSVERVAAIAGEFTAVEEAEVVEDATDGQLSRDEEGTLRLRLSGPFVATALADHGIVLGQLAAAPDCARIVLEVPQSVGARTADEVLGSVYEDRTLRAQRELPRTLGTERGRSSLLDRLTDRQLEVARRAYHDGYYGYPRESTGEDVADALDVSPATFYQTNQRILRALFEHLFEGTHRPDDGSELPVGEASEPPEPPVGEAPDSSSEGGGLDY